MAEEIVQGYTFESVSSHDTLIARYHGNVCKIVRRAGDNDLHVQDLLDIGPAFVVEFGDGHQEVVYSVELHPWYPT